jgi:hypothetical protein
MTNTKHSEADRDSDNTAFPAVYAQSGIGNAPLYKERRGRVQMAIWTRQDKNGGVRFSVSLTRSYKTEEGFRDTGSLDPRDLTDAVALLTMARAILPEEVTRKIAPPQS